VPPKPIHNPAAVKNVLKTVVKTVLKTVLKTKTLSPYRTWFETSVCGQTATVGFFISPLDF